jgi:uncharacterized lipoprotein YajG
MHTYLRSMLFAALAGTLIAGCDKKEESATEPAATQEAAPPMESSEMSAPAESEATPPAETPPSQ